MKTAFTYLVYIFALIGFGLVAAYTAVEFGFTKTSGIIDKQHDYFKNQTASVIDTSWANNEEWQVLKEAVLKDQDVINRAANVAHVPARFIVSSLIVEQLRLFYSEREVFKAVFAPLKILGNQSQFSWGVMGIKQDTAIKIESNLKDQASPYYLGPDYEHLLDFTTNDHDTERFNRLTDEDNRYYSYLYAGLAMKELETQWQKAGNPIDSRPDIVATLFNIGFDNSHPHPSPIAGGAEIDIGSSTYSFGSLAGDFYNSNELINEFPRN